MTHRYLDCHHATQLNNTQAQNYQLTANVFRIVVSIQQN